MKNITTKYQIDENAFNRKAIQKCFKIILINRKSPRNVIKKKQKKLHH